MTDKLYQTQYSKALNWLYFVTLQVCVAFAALTIYILVTSIRRIQLNIARLKSFNMLKDERFITYHVVAFGLFILNMVVYDVLVCAYASYAFPSIASVGVQICNYALPVSALVVQILLALIVKKYIGELEFLQLKERQAVDEEIEFHPSDDLSDTTKFENSSEYDQKLKENLKNAIKKTPGMDMHDSPMMDNNAAMDLIIDDDEDEIDGEPAHPVSGLNDSRAENYFEE